MKSIFNISVRVLTVLDANKKFIISELTLVQSNSISFVEKEVHLSLLLL